MASFDRESDIFKRLGLIPSEKVCPLTNSESEIELFESFKKHDLWIDNSNDTNDPPDYYNNADGYMMDFMRTNDYEIHKRNGKVVNNIAAAENRMVKEIEASGILDLLPNISKENIICVPKDDIKPSFTKYYNNIERVLEDHNKQTDNYRKNHPNCKLIFCVCDLSEHEHIIRRVNPDGKLIDDIVYNPCFDNSVLHIIKELDVDFVVWYRPWLMPTTDSPQLVIIDVHKLDADGFFDLKEIQNE